MIPKAPTDRRRHALGRRFVGAAREGWQAILEAVAPRGVVLLPAFIGVSPLEGSGLYDPIEATGARCVFYPVGDDLRADLGAIEGLLKELEVAAVLLVHYLGYPEPDTLAIRAACDEHGALLVEDCAHIVASAGDGFVCGEVGDAAFHSIHKVLPATAGGALVVRHPSLAALLDPPPTIDAADLAVLANADREAIAETLRRHRALLAELVEPIAGVRLLRPHWPDTAAPMNLAVRVEGCDRYALYRAMRAAGCEVTVVYHTLVDAIDAARFPVSHAIAADVINLPTHQDLTVEDLRRTAAIFRDSLAAVRAEGSPAPGQD